MAAPPSPLLLPTPPASGLTRRDYGMLILINIMWGLNIVAIKMALDEVSPFTAAFLRQALVAMVCLPWLRFVPGRMHLLILLGIFSGALFFIPMNLSLAVTNNVSALAIAGQLGAPFALILSVIFLKDRIGLPRLAGILMAFSGVMLLAFDPAIADEIPGLLLTALSSFFWAVGSLFTRKLRDVPVAIVYAWFGFVGCIILGPAALVFEPQSMAAIATFSATTFGWIAFSALGSTLIGHGGVAWLLQRHPISVVIPYTLIAPVIAVIVSAIVFDAPVTGMMVLGGVIVLGGVAIVTIRSAHKGTLIEEVP